MTDEERADVRTAYRPLLEGLRGGPGTVSYDEWAAAVDRVFPTDDAPPAPPKVRTHKPEENTNDER